MKKEKDMKKIAMIAVVCVIAAVTAFSFVACNPDELNLSNEVVATQPDITPTATLDASMSAIEMLEVGMENYYGANFAVARTTGALVTDVLSMKLTQFVKSVTLRDGAADEDNKLFYQNLSGTAPSGLLGSAIVIKIWEETDYEKTGNTEDIYFRGADTDKLNIDKHEENGVITDAWLEWQDGVVSFMPTEQYNDLTTYVKEKASDPTKMWMYDINENTILSDKTVAPTYNEEGGYYEFSVSGNVDANSPNYSVEEYEKQMLYMLQSQGQNPSKFYFTEITLDVQIWPNGFLRQVEVTESYMMVLMGFVNSEVTLESTKAFFFEEDSLPEDEAFDLDQIGSVKATYSA